MTEDRTRLPDGVALAERGWHVYYRPALYAELDTQEGAADVVTADVWAFVDRIRADERKRIADELAWCESNDSPVARSRCTVIGWLRAGARPVFRG